jgi:hypothetical protein
VILEVEGVCGSTGFCFSREISGQRALCLQKHRCGEETSYFRAQVPVVSFALLLLNAANGEAESLVYSLTRWNEFITYQTFTAEERISMLFTLDLFCRTFVQSRGDFNFRCEDYFLVLTTYE